MSSYTKYNGVRAIERTEDKGNRVTKYTAKIWLTTHNKVIKLGIFDTAERAAEARDLFAMKLFGDDVDTSMLNFPERIELYKKIRKESQLRQVQRAAWWDAEIKRIADAEKGKK